MNIDKKIQCKVKKNGQIPLFGLTITMTRKERIHKVKEGITRKIPKHYFSGTEQVLLNYALKSFSEYDLY